MAAQRLVQNFNDCRAFLITADARVEAVLAPVLTRLGLATSRVVGDRLPAVEKGDIVFLDGDLGQMPSLERHAFDDALPVTPVIGLVGMEAPSRLKALVQAGATAFLQKPIHGGAVYSTLYLAANEHARRAAMAHTLHVHEERRRQRRYVVKAVVRVMREHGLDDEAAFALLRSQSMRARTSIEAYCQHVVQRSTANPESGIRPDGSERLRSVD